MSKMYVIVYNHNLRIFHKLCRVSTLSATTLNVIYRYKYIVYWPCTPISYIPEYNYSYSLPLDMA